MTLNVIDIINNNDSDMIVKIIFRNSDDELVECFRGMIKDIPDNFRECEVLGTGFFDCALIHIEKTGE